MRITTTTGAGYTTATAYDLQGQYLGSCQMPGTSARTAKAATQQAREDAAALLRRRTVASATSPTEARQIDQRL